MIKIKFKLLALALAVVASMAMSAFAQQLPQVPIDPAIRYGKLDNGLTYYIRHNENPKERAEFYIAQNVGAILENDDQDGLAHFLEHMAFNGTTNFPEKGIIEYFEMNGVRFGYNINAYTSLDETVYNLSNVPTTRAGVVDSALLVLHDWSSFIALEAEEIDAERGVILEEWRSGQGPERRMWKELNKLKYPGSQYAIRDVIGDTAVINNFKHQALRDFYHKWYRPDLQAILVVGDIDVDVIEQKIKTMFADIPRKENFGERPVYSINNNVEPIVAIVTDPESRYTQIGLEYSRDREPREVKLSQNGYLLHSINSLISIMLSNRFNEITQQADAPFVAAYGYYGSMVKAKDAFQLYAIAHEGRVTEALDAILIEAEKVKRFGFTNSELERAKTDMLKNIEKQYNERDNLKNNSLVREYVRHYLDDEPIPGIEWEYRTLQVMLPQISTDWVNQIAGSFVTDENMIVSIGAPDKEKTNLPTVEGVLAAIQTAKNTELTAREEEDMNKPLINNLPKAGKIKKTVQNASLGVTEWTLSNGIKVIIKPTTFKQDEILMTAYSEGGLSKINNINDLPSAAFATDIVSGNGLGNYSNIELQKILTGKIARVNPYIGNYEEGFSGNSSVADFETMMQLLYLYFTAPRKDDNAYKALMNMMRTSLSNVDKDPRKAFSDSIMLTLNGHHPRLILSNLTMLEKVNQDKAISIYKERFAVPADFTFVFVGNIDPNDKKTQNVISTYLGGLKTSKKKEKYDDRGIRRPDGKINNYFTQEMQVKKSSNFISYAAPMPYNLQNRTLMTAIGNILTMRYMESIREKEGGSYGVGVRGSLGKIPVEQATLIMQFDTDPEKQEKLMQIIHEEADKIVAKGPQADDLFKVKENLLKQYAEDIEENSWWRNTIALYYQYGINLPQDYKASVEALTRDNVQTTMRNLIRQNNVIEVVMSPAE